MFTYSVIIAMTGNPAFPNPLVPLAELSALQMDFEQKLTASKIGGKVATALKNESRKALLGGLRSEGIYVQGASSNRSTLLSSGYLAASQNRAQVPLVKPCILKILNEATGQLTLRVTPVANARNYQVEVQVGDGAWQQAGIFSQVRRMVVTNMTPGTMYKIRVRALGGSNGTSDWSMIYSRMAI
jgi:hypothetical protein